MSELSNKMRIWHRYLGFFLVGIMAVYAISGVILIFRDTDFLKNEIKFNQDYKPGVEGEELGKMLKVRNLKVTSTEGDIVKFKEGFYNKSTGHAEFSIKELPKAIDKLCHLHKAKSSEPLFFLNVFFGFSLLFFVISSFWMFLPGSGIFRKGMYFTIAGILLTLILLFL
jgi:hypothetical protein